MDSYFDFDEGLDGVSHEFGDNSEFFNGNESFFCGGPPEYEREAEESSKK